MDQFTAAYLEAMAFTDCHGDNPELNEASGFSEKLIAGSRADCAAFQFVNAALLESAYGTDRYTRRQAGHDFWLTRNGHGAGFWDRGLGEVGEALTKAADLYGSVDLYADEDGQIYSA